MRFSGKVAFLACLLGAQLINPLGGQALAMSMIRAPFHNPALLRAILDQPVWRTFAGYPNSPGTNDGPGISARFSNPSGIVVDASGTAYVADSGNHTIREISPAGIVTTIAGQSGVSGYKDGPATNALFNGPTALALDSDGTLYVADSGNYVIRKIVPAGMVSTLAGRPGASGCRDGIGTNAVFAYIGGLALDTNHNLYVADSQNSVIRKVTPAGVVSTWAGKAGSQGFQDGAGTNAQFGNPQGLALDSSGVLYVADSGNNVIRRIDPSGNVTTWVGGNYGYRDAQGTNAWFANPAGLAFDNQGNLYVAETYGAVRKVSADGEVLSLGGTPGAAYDHVDGLGTFARFSSPCAIGVSPSGHLLVVDSGNNTIRYGSVGPEPYPQILSQPGSQTVPAGGNATLSVQAQSQAPLTYQWLANGQTVAGATAASLTLEDLQESNAGEYRVAVSDGIGYRLSLPASLKVLPVKTPSGSPLDNWHQIASAPLTEIHGLAYGNGRYVAIGGGYSEGDCPRQNLKGSVATSTDGQRWIKQFPITSETLNGVAFGNGLFVTVGTKGAVLTSTNGLEWEAQTLTPEGRPTLNGITFDQGLFVAVSGDVNGSIWTSPDGQQWTNRGVDFGVSFMDVQANAGRFLAVGNTIMTSTNGVNWEPVASVPTNYIGQTVLLEHIALGNGTILAAQHAWSGYLAVAASANGLAWRDIAPTNGLWPARATFGNGQFLAVDLNSGGVTVSDDGTNWSAPAMVSCGGLSCPSPHLAFGQGMFVAAGDSYSGAGALFTSTNGMSWMLCEQEQALPFPPHTLLSLGGQYFAAGGGNGIESSTNGSDWHLLLATNYFSDVGYGTGTMVAVGGGDLVWRSQDGGATWTDQSPHLNYGTASPSLDRVVYGSGTFVAAGSLYYSNPNGPGISKVHILASEDQGATWKAASFTSAGTIFDMAYGNGLFVAREEDNNGSAPNGKILISTNGLTWTSAVSFATTSLTAVVYGNGRFVVGLSGGGVVVSSNGTEWNLYALGSAPSLNSIVFGDGLFLATGYSTSAGRSVLRSSADGITWTECAGPDADMQNVLVGDGVFLATDGDGNLYQSGPLERLANPRRLPNTDLEWTASGAAGINYRIEFSEDLLNWQTLAHVTNAPAAYPFTDPAAGNAPKRFYRIVTE